MATVEDHDLGYSAIVARVKELDGKSVKAGIFADSGTGGGKTSLIDVAIYNEYGTSRGIPPRPFMRITADKKAESWGALASQAAARVVDGMSPEQCLDLVGNKMKGDIQETFGSGDLAPNAPATIRRKGSAAPLVDTGRLRSSVQFKKGND